MALHAEQHGLGTHMYHSELKISSMDPLKADNHSWQISCIKAEKSQSSVQVEWLENTKVMADYMN